MMGLCWRVFTRPRRNWLTTWNLIEAATVLYRTWVLMPDKVCSICTSTCSGVASSAGRQDSNPAPMRIAIDYTAAIRQGAGVGNYVRSLVDAMLAQDSSNSYTLLASGRPPRDRPF